MSKLTCVILLVFCQVAVAQKIFLYPRVAVAPRGTYQSVTAIVTGINDRRVAWTASGGKIVGGGSCAIDEPCTIALVSDTPGKYTLTATSNADHSLSASAEVSFTESPQPVTTHPRLGLTAEMLPRLRAKAVAKNPLYESLKTRAGNFLERDANVWSWTCKGGSGHPSSDQSQSYKENDAFMFAMMSEIAPTKQERDQWGCYGHDVFMTMIGYVISGSLDLGKGNHWADSAREFAFTADYLLGGDYLTPSDMSVTRKYLAKLAFEQINNIYNGELAVVGKYNSPAQFEESSENSSNIMRGMGNNYTHAKILLLSAAALTFNDNPTDDPPLSNTCNATRYQVCPDGTAGSLHAYWSYVSGGMLYKDWADMEDAGIVQPAYNAAFNNLPSQPMCQTLWQTPMPCLGEGRGGESSEGTSYGSSIEKLMWALNAIHTAGYDDPLRYGPQMSLHTMSYWDLRYVADLSLLTGLSGVPSDKARWNFITDGDSLSYFIYPSGYGAEAAMLEADSYVGRTDRTAALKWLLMNSAFGTANGKVGGCTSYCGIVSELGNDYGSRIAPDLFVALTAEDLTNVADARTSLPTDWYDAGNQHILVRDNWSTGANTIFSDYCTNTQIDHEHQFCGGFDVYSQGEYITKGRMEFNDYNDEFSLARNKNSVMLVQYPGQTWCTANPWCTFNQAATDGGQFWHEYEAGLTTLRHAELPGYVAAIADDRNAYNGAWGVYAHFRGVTAASRSLVYLRRSNEVIYYDRGETGSNAWDKANYLITTGQPSFNGNTASWLTRSGRQKVYWTALAPSGKAPELEKMFDDGDAKNDWEIYGRIKVDAGKTGSARFLSILQWGPASFSATAPSLVASSAGRNFEGALVGSSLVMFIRERSANFTTMSYPASGATTQYVADLSPNMSYTISGAGAPERGTADNAGVLTFHADGQGSITISAIH